MINQNKQMLQKAGEEIESKILEIQKIQKQMLDHMENLSEEELKFLDEDEDLEKMERKLKNLIDEIWN